MDTLQWDDGFIVYECFARCTCLTIPENNFDITFAVCSSLKKAKLFRKGFLLEEWKHKGYEFYDEELIPGTPGHKYYFKKDSERWLIATYIFERKIDDLWTGEN